MRKKLGEKRFETLMLQANAGSMKKCKDDKLMMLYIKQLLKTHVNAPNGIK